MLNGIPFWAYLQKASEFRRAEIRRHVLSNTGADTDNINYIHVDDRLIELINTLQIAPVLVLGSQYKPKKQLYPTVSIQASVHHSSEPRGTFRYNHCTSFEIGFPACERTGARILRPYLNQDTGKPNPETGVYSYVPTAVVQQYVDAMDGIIGYINHDGYTIVPLEITAEEVTFYSLQ